MILLQTLTTCKVLANIGDMLMKRQLAICLALVATLSVIWVNFHPLISAAEPNVAVDDEMKPADVNMHDFMEGMFQVPYRRLKTAMEKEPMDPPAWKALRSDALILTELATFYLFASRKKTFPIGSSTASLLATRVQRLSRQPSKRILRLVKRLMYGCLFIAMLAISNSKTASTS